MTNTDSPPPGALPVLLAGAFMVVLDFFIVNVALPAIAVDLRASDSTLEWVVAGYGLSFAVLLVIAGRLGDELGRRRMYAAGLALFTLASAACGAAPDAATLLAARAVQGAAGALVMPQVLSTLQVAWHGEAHQRALSIYGVVLGLAAVGGQILGGALVGLDPAGLGWRACFLVNVPVGLLALALTPRLVPETRAPSRARLDLGGALVLAVALVAILVPLIEGRRAGWPLWTWASLAGAVVLIELFVARQRARARAGREPLLDLGLFRAPAFSAGLVTQLLLACVQASFFVYLALYLQVGRGLSALEAGLVFAIVAVAYVAASGPAPGLTARYGRAVVVAGGAALLAGFGLLALVVGEAGTSGSLVALAPGLALAGAGVGLCYTPLTMTVLAGVEPARAGAASGAMATTQQVGYSLGVALTGLVFFAGHELGSAFAWSLAQLAVLAVGIVFAARRLPARGGAAEAQSPLSYLNEIASRTR